MAAEQTDRDFGTEFRRALEEGMAQHILKAAGGTPDEEDLAATRAVAAAAVDYLAEGFSGGKSLPALMWAMCTAMWRGKAPQRDIDAFFASVRLDPWPIFKAWKQSDPASQYTTALIPGDLAEADIADVARALYAQRRS